MIRGEDEKKGRGVICENIVLVRNQTYCKAKQQKMRLLLLVLLAVTLVGRLLVHSSFINLCAIPSDKGSEKFGNRSGSSGRVRDCSH